MKDEKQRFREKISHELSNVSFQKQENVLAKTHPKHWTEKMQAWFDKEVEVPLLPVTAFVGGVMVIALLLLGPFSQEDVDKGHLVNIEGNVYWSEMLEERMK